MTTSDHLDANGEYQLPAGTVVAERYRVLSRLGSGGMGSVYLAADKVLGEEKVAIKILHKSYAHNQVQTARFLREVQLMRKINHKNVVRTYDVGADGDILYFTMEFVPGSPLEQFIGPRGIDKDDIPKYAKQIAEALHAIHAAGVIHRDLKPGNILVLSDGTIRITDFGVARPEYSQLTAHDELLGSVCYMAPELWLSKPLTPSVDLYALGIILYEMSTGMVPFDGESPAVLMRAHLDRAPVPPRESNAAIAPWLNKLILRLLAKSPADRPHDAREIIETIRLHTEGGGDERRQSGAPESAEFFQSLEAKTQNLTSGVHQLLERGDVSLSGAASQQRLSVLRTTAVRGSGKFASEHPSRTANGRLRSPILTFVATLGILGTVRLVLSQILPSLFSLFAPDNIVSRAEQVTTLPSLTISGLILLDVSLAIAVLALPVLPLALALLPSRLAIQGYISAAMYLAFSFVALSAYYLLGAPPAMRMASFSLYSAAVTAKDQLCAVALLSPLTNLYEQVAVDGAVVQQAVAVAPIGASWLSILLTLVYLFLLVFVLLPLDRARAGELVRRRLSLVTLILGFLILVEPLIVRGGELSDWGSFGLIDLRLPFKGLVLSVAHWCLVYVAAIAGTKGRRL